MNTRRAYVALALATLAFAVSFAIWSLLSPLATQLQKQYNIGDFEISVLIAVPVILGSLVRIPMGILTDRFGGRKVMTALLLFCVVPCLGMQLADSYTALLFWGFLLGVAGSSFAVGVPFVSRWFGPEKHGLVIGIFGMGNIGTAISARLAPELAKGSGGYHTVFLVFAAIVLAMAVLFYLFAGDEKRLIGPTKTIGQRMTVLRTEKLTWVFSLFYFVTFGGFVAFALYLPKLLTDLYGLDKVDAGNRAAVFVIVATLARPMGGWLSDKRSPSQVLMSTFAVVPLMALVLAFSPGIEILTVCFLVIAAFLGLGSGAVFKLVPQYFATEAGTVTGLVGAAGGLGGFFPPLVMGVCKSALGSYSIGYILLSVVALFCLGLTIAVFGSNQRRPAPQTR